MASYRLFFLDERGQVCDAREFESKSDRDAIDKAERLANGRRGELWRHARLVRALDAGSRPT
jgi:hypothetical protein